MSPMTEQSPSPTTERLRELLTKATRSAPTRDGAAVYDHASAVIAARNEIVAALPQLLTDLERMKGAQALFEAIREFGPNGEVVEVRAHANGDWDCYDPASPHTEISKLQAEIAELREALKPFADAARNLCLTAPDGIDDGLTVTAFVECRREREAVLGTAQFHRARTLLNKDKING